ncbi:MAG TPA: energy transducer TonB [Candidatus Obscuribacterales bacterium]
MSCLTAATVTIGLCSFAPPTAVAHNFLQRRLAIGDRADTAPRIREKWALLIGVDKFQDPAIAANKPALKNVEMLSAALENPAAGKFAHSHVTVLTGQQATASGITDAIEGWLATRALPDDLIFVYVCSVTNTDEKGNPKLFAYDTLGSESALSGLDLVETLHAIRQRTGSHYVVCALDTSDAPGAKGFDVEPVAKSGVSILSATNGHQHSLNNGVTGSSVFVHHLIEALSHQAGQYTLQQVYDHVLDQVTSDAEKAFHTHQSPILALADDGPASQITIGALPRGGAGHPGFAIGHPVDRLAIDHPNLIPPPPGGPVSHQPAPRPKATAPAAKPKPAPKNSADDDEAPAKDVDFSAYMTKMKQDIQKHWSPPHNLESRRIVAVFSIQRDGRIVDAHIVEGSGAAEIDQSALDALKAASPLDPLPPGSPASVDIKYKFDWQVKRD